jgi:hypothetical protein
MSKLFTRQVSSEISSDVIDIHVPNNQQSFRRQPAPTHR